MADDEDDSGGGRTNRSNRARTNPEGIDTTEARLRALEFKNAEVFGAEGDGGSFRALEKDMRAVKKDVLELKTFQTKALTTIGLAAGFATLIVGLATVLLEHYLK